MLIAVSEIEEATRFSCNHAETLATVDGHGSDRWIRRSHDKH
jgi:hypothetical protein